MTRAAVLCLMMLLLISRCDRVEPPAEETKTPAPAVEPTEKNNLASILRGATIMSRTGEASLDFSALAAFDSDRGTVWSTPPVNLEQSVTIALPVRSRVEEIAVWNDSTLAARAIRTFEFSTSVDGETFSEPRRLQVPKQAAAHLFPFPVEASFIRFTPIDTYGETTVLDVPSIEVRGRELERFRPRSLAGSWRINDAPAFFEESGSRSRGVIQLEPPMYVDGGWHERMFRFLWVRGKKEGVGFFTLDPSSRHLSGFWWFATPARVSSGLAMFGDKQSDGGASTDTANVLKSHLERTRRIPLLQLSLHKSVEENASILREIIALISANPSARFVIASRNWTGDTFEERQRLAEQQLASFRQMFAEVAPQTLANLSFAAVGEKEIPQDSDQPLARLLMTRLELELHHPAP